MVFSRHSAQFLVLCLPCLTRCRRFAVAFQQPITIRGFVKPSDWPGINQKPSSVPLADLKSYREPTYENKGLQRTDAQGSVLGLTENKALTYVATGSKCLNLFFDVLPDIPEERFQRLLEEAWKEDAPSTLKIIFQLGDPRKGKGDRKNLYRALVWLYENHFETLLLNIEHVRAFSCYKTMLDLLVLVARGPDALDDKRPVFHHRNWGTRAETHRMNINLFFNSTSPSGEYVSPESVYDEDKKRWKDAQLRDKFVAFISAQDKTKSAQAAVSRRQKQKEMLDHANHLYGTSSKFRRLYDKVADIFATDLQCEKERLVRYGGKEDFSLSGLAAKWAPSPKRSHDKQTNICEGIISRLYHNDKRNQRGSFFTLLSGTLNVVRRFLNGDKDIDENERLRIRYQQEYLTPLRRAAQVPESFTGSGDWHLVNYKRMASRCRAMHGQMYRRHDQKRYDEYLQAAVEEVEQGGRVTRVSAGSLLPHEITKRAINGVLGQVDEEAGLQWLRLVQDVKDKGKVTNAVSICDVSGSMVGKPMAVAIALSLLVADTSEGAWGNKVITFSQNPKLVAVPRPTVDNLASRVSYMKGMEWGYNTDFQKVFDLLLETAKEHRLLPEGMPTILFCFSDMEFDKAHEGNWKTDLELIRKKYDEFGYDMPEIVFWNLRASTSKPASKYEPGVAMLSGFSAGLMKSFLEFRLDDFFNPMSQLQSILQAYDRLVVAEADRNESVATND